MKMGSLDEFILELATVEAIKFGSFTLKSGQVSPIYFDLRVLVSYPRILAQTSKLLLQAFTPPTGQVVCGVPYTALPMATLMSVEAGMPMVVRRKEAKDYGTKKMVEGVWKEGQGCLVVEDVVTTGSSVLETAALLREHGMVVTDCVVLLDREQGAVGALSGKGVAVHAVLKVSTVLEVLVAHKRISGETAERVRAFLSGNRLPAPPHIGLEERVGLASNATAKKLLRAMVAQSSNLCVSIDCTTSEEMLRLADLVGPQVVLVKLHRDVISDWTETTEAELLSLATKHGFLLFEDRKLADIGNTVKLQANAAAGDWAELVTVHGVAGPGTLEGLASAWEGKRDVAALLVVEMSCAGNLAVGRYSEACIALGKHRAVAGFIAQSPITKDPGQLQLTPGVHLSASQDGRDQRYVTPRSAVLDRGADVIIVGRGITGASDPLQTARQYRSEGWAALVEREQQ